jgi:hypothetical protein
LLGFAILVWTIQAQVVQIYVAISATAACGVSSGCSTQRRYGKRAVAAALFGIDITARQRMQ